MKKSGFSLQKELREDVGLRVDFEKSWGFFCKMFWERRLDCGLISLKSEDFFAKWPGNGRSRPFARPIGRPGKAGDVATLTGRGIGQDSLVKITTTAGVARLSACWIPVSTTRTNEHDTHYFFLLHPRILPFLSLLAHPPARPPRHWRRPLLQTMASKMRPCSMPVGQCAQPVL